MTGVSVLILTKNEEINIERCIQSVSWSDDIVVYDSLSDDRTVELAEKLGARVVKRKFDNWSAHQNWAVANIDFKHPWVYYTDADETCEDQLKEDLGKLAQKGEGYSEDKMAFFRDVTEYKNLLILELENGDWGKTIARQFLFDTYNYFLYTELLQSKDEHIRAVAQKAIKEITYHAQWSAEWVIRLGDGTEESHNRIQSSVNDLWEWTGEMFTMDEVEKKMLDAGIAPNLTKIKEEWDEKVTQILEIATLEKPEDGWMQSGGKQGEHTEYIGFLLAEMQHLPRMYPQASW